MPRNPTLAPDAITRIQDLVLQQYGLEASKVRPLPGEYDLNGYLEAENGAAYLVKISPPGTEPTALAFQHAMAFHLAERLPQLSWGLPVATLSGEHFGAMDWQGEPRHFRLLQWVDGRPWAQVRPHTPALLRSLGSKLGAMSVALADFAHPHAPQRHEWDIARTPELVEPGLEAIPDRADRQVARYFLDLFYRRASPGLDALPRAINYNDANDYNVLVSHDRRQPEVVGFIDFGDAVRTHRINELAIALAYAMMDKPDPLAAARPVIEAYCEQCSLREDEVELLFPLIGARLLLSVVHAARRARARPENAYLQISSASAWRLLRQLRDLPPDLAHYQFRHACGWPAHPAAEPFRAWARQQSFHPPVDLPAPEQVGPIDLSVLSPYLGHADTYRDVRSFQQHLARLFEREGLQTAIGGYGEVRPFYTTQAYARPGLEGPQWRTVHLGLDIWQPAGSNVYAPWAGEIWTAVDNAGERNYGPTLILKHPFGDGRFFYTLYGHLDRACLHGKQRGDRVAAGDRLGAIGAPSENGGWAPHLHWQVLLDPLGDSGDFPGVGEHALRAMWLDLCPDPALLLPADWKVRAPAQESPEDILSSRKRHLGPNLSLSYEEPLYMLRGQGSYLLDHTARRYLDTVNNVAHVGHEHPRVVEAIQRQAALLNTNTRYLHHLLPSYAERLLAWFPEPLSVVYFVNSGSEANELALRMVRTLTGRRDMLAMQTGYHGNTGATIDISSYKFEGKGGSGRPATTLLLPMPDPLRQRPEAALNDLEIVLSNLLSEGARPAGFIAESILSCGGQVELPAGYLQRVYAAMRSIGALCIADEVQTGFGRVGTHRWAFEMQGVTPDIVTLGKPIGNGHPLGAVVCTRSVAEAFDNGMEYFNTFAGNPVSCAAGLAVLDVLEQEKLQVRARDTGAYLRERLLALQNQHPIIGQVRGPGYFQGVELVADPDSLEPATAQGHYLINRMRRHGILMSTDGPFNNVLKIKPPMVFGRPDVDFLVEMLDKVLDEDFLAR